MTLTQINKAGLDELALDHVFTIGASGTDHYTFQGEGLNGTVNDPTLYLTRGKTYRFENGSGGHPIRIQSTSGASGTAYNTGVTNNAGSGTVIVEVQHDAPDVLYYQCTSHANMNGVLYITGALADGGVTTAKLADDAVTDAKLANSINASIAANTAKTTNATHTGDVTGSTSLTIANDAVTSAKIADDAVTTAKIASGAVTTARLVNDAVTTAKIEDQAVTLAKLPHGTGSNDGKFLRANNGADPTFETIPPAAITAVSSTGANRVITDDGDGTATAESSLIFDGTKLAVTGSTVGNGVSLEISSAAANSDSRHIDLVRGGNHGYVGMAGSQPNDPLFLSRSGGRDIIVSSAGKVGIGMSSGSSPDDTLDVVGTMQVSSNSYQSNIYLSGSLFMGGTGSANEIDDYEEGTWTPTMATSSGGDMNGSYSVRAGRYTKIGRIVHCRVDVTWNNWTNRNATVMLKGLPFTNYSSGALGGYGAPQFRDLSGINDDIRRNGNSSWLVNNNTVIYMMAYNDSGGEYYVSANQSGRITGEFIIYTNNT